MLTDKMQFARKFEKKKSLLFTEKYVKDEVPPGNRFVIDYGRYERDDFWITEHENFQFKNTEIRNSCE